MMALPKLAFYTFTLPSYNVDASRLHGLSFEDLVMVKI